jgi:hypothetical protein
MKMFNESVETLRNLIKVLETPSVTSTSGTIMPQYSSMYGMISEVKREEVKKELDIIITQIKKSCVHLIKSMTKEEQDLIDLKSLVGLYEEKKTNIIEQIIKK